MNILPIEGDTLQRVVESLALSPLFSSMPREHLPQVATRSTLLQFAPNEVIVTKGAASDSFFLLLSGSARVMAPAKDGNLTEVAVLQKPDSIGEMGLLLKQERSATVQAKEQLLALQFEEQAFHTMFERIPGFGLAVSRALAVRLQTSAQQIPLKAHDQKEQIPESKVINMLPIEFLQRHRVVPVHTDGQLMVLGFVNDPSPMVMNGARQLLPAMEMQPVRITEDFLEKCLRSTSGVDSFSASEEESPASDGFAAGQSETRQSPRLDQLLRRMIAEGASDLHLSAGEKPRWRIDGYLEILEDCAVLGGNEVLSLLKPGMLPANISEFEADHDTDFAYAIPELARFRVNLFVDHGGIGAVLRQIPATILTVEQLGLPDIVERMANQAKGLVLVTGPTGSGKSTTLAAMIDQINKNQQVHILTLEDPIEFVHKSQRALINQREIGPHSNSFNRALRAALREDPDIILVGEMRDVETVSLALETANTGHLVFGTLHTATAISTVNRIIDLFPADEQNQVRAGLADALKGVIAQTLCRKMGGGRVAALEILVANHAVCHLIREGKTHQIVSTMSTQRALGNRMLNQELARLVESGVVAFDEALSKSQEKAELAKLCGRKFDVNAA
jgi:pilus retraction protein PilT